MPGWVKGDHCLFYAMAQKPDGACYYLKVKMTDESDHRWLWRAGKPNGWSREGYAQSAIDAMKAAEAAVAA